MHPNPAFRHEPDARNLEFARARGFGILSVNDDAGPLVSHVPFLLNGDGSAADLHLVRSNPIAQRTEGPAVLAVSGPDGYVSPDWYGIEDQVPTWNYVAVHLRGRLVRLPQGEMRDMLDRQSAFFETRLLPKPVWLPGKMSHDVLEKMMRAIIPFRLMIDKVDGTWKLGQNKPDRVRLSAAALMEEGSGSQLSELAALMRSAGPKNEID